MTSLPREMAAVERQPGQVVDHLLAAADGKGHLPRRLGVTDDAVGSKSTPQAGNSFSRLEKVSVAHARLLLAHRLRLGVRVDEHQHLAAAHDELVDGVDGLLAQRLRVNEQQRADILAEAVDVAAQ